MVMEKSLLMRQETRGGGTRVEANETTGNRSLSGVEFLVSLFKFFKGCFLYFQAESIFIGFFKKIKTFQFYIYVTYRFFILRHFFKAAVNTFYISL
jgi:hypothetical protein